MKYSLALLFSIFSFACANSPFEQHQNNYDPNAEIDKLWREHFGSNVTADNLQNIPQLRNSCRQNFNCKT